MRIHLFVKIVSIQTNLLRRFETKIVKNCFNKVSLEKKEILNPKRETKKLM